MSDQKLRELERYMKETGSVEDEANYLLERIRTGYPLEKLQLAAYLGYGPAVKALEHFPAKAKHPRVVQLDQEYFQMEKEREELMISLLEDEEEFIKESFRTRRWFEELKKWPMAYLRGLIASARQKEAKFFSSTNINQTGTIEIETTSLNIFEEHILGLSPSSTQSMAMAYNILHLGIRTADQAEVRPPWYTDCLLIAQEVAAEHGHELSPWLGCEQTELRAFSEVQQQAAITELLSWALEHRDPVRERVETRASTERKQIQAETRQGIVDLA